MELNRAVDSYRQCSVFVLMTSRRFPPPWSVDRPHPDSFVVKDANGIVVATVHCRDDLQKWSFGHSRLSSEDHDAAARVLFARTGQLSLEAGAAVSRRVRGRISAIFGPHSPLG
jgi:hypothetical protein